ncbi:MAG: hypothetical protein KGJ08_01870 [Gammaproteobacteria bacterium]|nr:hypothetical protein [Gammaproteobacteria bacterium]
MIPNIINTLLGLVLVYAAVLNPALMTGRFYPMLIASVVILIMAIWARRSDNHPWQSSVNIIMAILLAVLALLPLRTFPIVTFWGGFWVGVIVSVMALWALLYRPGISQTS